MLRRSPLFAAAILAVLSLFAVPIARGQDDPPFIGSVEVAEMKAIKVRKLSAPLASEFDGTRGVFVAPKGKAFLVLHLELKPTYAPNPQGEEVCYAYPEAVKLQVEGAELAWSVGTCDPHGRFQAYPGGYTIYQSDDRATGGFDPAFVVPEGATKATLTLGGTTHPISMPSEVVEGIDPAQAIQLKAESPRIVTEMQREQLLGTYEHEEGQFVQQVVTSAGRFLLVPIVMKPKVRNQPTGYSATVDDFGLLLGKEVYAAPVGAFENGKFSDYASDFYFEKDALGEYNAAKATLVFPLPGAVKSGKLLYYGAPVADLSFGP